MLYYVILYERAYFPGPGRRASEVLSSLSRFSICTSTLLYMYIYIYIYICIYIYMYMYTSVSLSLYIYIYICICTHTYTHNMFQHVLHDIPTCVPFMCVYIYIYIHTITHTNIHKTILNNGRPEARNCSTQLPTLGSWIQYPAVSGPVALCYIHITSNNTTTTTTTTTTTNNNNNNNNMTASNIHNANNN